MEEQYKFNVGEKKMVLKGMSKNIYYFFISQLSFPLESIDKTKFENCPGVYVLLADNPTSIPIIDLFQMGMVNQKINDLPFNYIYIGETNDLSKEFKNHPRLNCFKQHRIFLVLWIDEGNEKERIKIVEDLLPTQNFLCN